MDILGAREEDKIRKLKKKGQATQCLQLGREILAFLILVVTPKALLKVWKE